MSLTFKILTFGCRVNQVESIEIGKSLQKVGFKPATTKASPDIVIINTCVVTQKAEKEVRQLTRRVRRENPKSFLVLLGCGVNFWQKVGFPKLPVNLWLQNEEKEKIAQVLKEKFFFTLILKRNGVKPTDSYQKSGRLIIKIQDGCNKFCSFCLVPYLRGKPKSKKINQIVEEAKNAQKSGVKEIILSGINLGLFGQDTNENIPQLLKLLLKKTDIPRISFGSIYPKVITDKLVNLYVNDWQNEDGRLCRFFHLPLQSGSAKVLRLMRRKYSLEKFSSIVKTLHQSLPEALIATDIIVGFPGEGEKEFRQTYKFLKNLPIFKFHIFRFSSRKGTLAFKMEKKWGKVEERVKKERAKILKNLEEEKYKKFLKTLVAKKLPILILEKRGKEALGMADNSVLVKFSLEKGAKDKIAPVLVEKVDFPFLIGKTLT